MISKQKETDLVNQYRGKHAAEDIIQERRGNAKYVNYAIYLLDNDTTVYVNLDKGTAHLSEKPNKQQIKAYREKEAQKLKDQQEGKAPAKPRVKKAPKVVKARTPKSKFTPEREARIQEIMEAKGCTRGNAIRALWNEESIKEADAKVTPKTEQKPVDPLAKATVYA